MAVGSSWERKTAPMRNQPISPPPSPRRLPWLTLRVSPRGDHSRTGAFHGTPLQPTTRKRRSGWMAPTSEASASPLSKPVGMWGEIPIRLNQASGRHAESIPAGERATAKDLFNLVEGI